MPFALVFIGLIMIVTAAKGTIKPLGAQLVKDFSGKGNFFYWFVAIGAVGALGAIPQFKAFSRTFMSLIIISMVLKNGGVFDKLSQALANGPVASAASAAPTPGAAGSSGGSSGAAGIKDIAGAAASLIPGGSAVFKVASSVLGFL